MPVVYDENNENQGTINGQQTTQPSGIVGSGGTSAPGSISSGANASPTSAQGQPTRSGSFTNLRAYLDANKGQGQAMANKMSKNILDNKDTFQKGVQGIQNQFNTQVQGSGTSYGDAEKALINQVGTNPLNVDVNAFAKLRDAKYTGPNNLSDIADFNAVQQNFKNLSQQQQQLGTEAGRMELLKNSFKAPSYNRGQQTLDQFLVQTSPEARQNLAALRQQLDPVAGYFDTAKQSAGELAKQRAADTLSAKKAALSAVGIDETGAISGGALGGLQETLQQRMIDLPKQKQKEYEEYLARLAPEQQAQQEIINNRKQALIKSLGEKWLGDYKARDVVGAKLMAMAPDFRDYIIDREALKAKNYINNIFSRNESAIPGLNNFVDYTPPTLTTSSVATQDELARAQALSKLANIDNVIIPNQQEVGSYLNLAPKFNRDAYSNSISDYLNSLIGGIDTSYRD